MADPVVTYAQVGPDQLIILRALKWSGFRSFDKSRPRDAPWEMALPLGEMVSYKSIGKEITDGRVTRTNGRAAIFEVIFSAPLNTPADLCTFLTDQSKFYSDCIVLGQLTAHGARFHSRMPRKDSGQTKFTNGYIIDPTLTDRQQSFLILDLDCGNLPHPAMSFPQAAHYVVRTLWENVPWLNGVAMVVQASSSWGTPEAGGQLKCHVFIMLQEPRTLRQIGQRLRQEDTGFKLDMSLYTPCHILYICSPEFKGYFADPLPTGRFVLVGDASCAQRATMPLPDAYAPDVAFPNRHDAPRQHHAEYESVSLEQLLQYAALLTRSRKEKSQEIGANMLLALRGEAVSPGNGWKKFQNIVWWIGRKFPKIYPPDLAAYLEPSVTARRAAFPETSTGIFELDSIVWDSIERCREMAIQESAKSSGGGKTFDNPLPTIENLPSYFEVIQKLMAPGNSIIDEFVREAVALVVATHPNLDVTSFKGLLMREIREAKRRQKALGVVRDPDPYTIEWLAGVIAEVNVPSVGAQEPVLNDDFFSRMDEISRGVR